MAAKKCMAGHQGCSCGMACCSIPDERVQQIRREAQSGTRWASLPDQDYSYSSGAACTCGAGQRLFDAANAFKGVHGRPSGLCDRHPGGTVWAPPAGLWKKIKEGE